MSEQNATHYFVVLPGHTEWEGYAEPIANLMAIDGKARSVKAAMKFFAGNGGTYGEATRLYFAAAALPYFLEEFYQTPQEVHPLPKDLVERYFGEGVIS